MDYLGPLINNFRTNSTVFQRFKKKWGHSGNLYDHRLSFYKHGKVVEDERMKRFLLSIGSSIDDLKDNDYDEVEEAWFYFNKNKQPGGSGQLDVTASDLSSALNSVLNVGDKVRVRLTYGGSTQTYLLNHQEGWSINNVGEIESDGVNTSEIFKKIHSDPWLYIANIDISGNRDTTQFHSIDTGYGSAGNSTVWNTNSQPKGTGRLKSTPATTTSIMKSTSYYANNSQPEYFSLALLDETHSVFEPTLDDNGEIKIFDTNSSSYGKEMIDDGYDAFDENGDIVIHDSKDVDIDRIGLSSSTTREYEFTFKGSTSNSQLILDIVNYFPYLSKRSTLNNNIMDTMQKRYMNMLRVEAGGSGKWDTYFSGNQLIKDKVDSMKRYEFVNLLSDCLDSDFKAEEASFFEKIFAVILVVAAIAVTLFTAGAFGATTFSLMNLALGLGYGSLVLTVGTMVLSQMGLSAASLVKTIGRVAQIIGIAATVVGIMAAAQNAFNRLAQEAVDKGTIQSVGDYTVSSFVSDAFSNAFDKLTSSFASALDVLSNPIEALLGSSTTPVDTSLSGWIGRLENAMKMTSNFMGNSGTSQNPETPTEEQMEKTAFQYPDDMYELQEQTVYEPDALQKMSIMKDDQFGLAATEKLLDRIA